MNALANSQLEELNKFLGPNPPVTFKRYTGQEDEETRHEIRKNPPDILLTNYVMLELLLTHSRDQPLVNAMDDLRFLVLDELHTYRGRQGADVAFLCRRLREASGASNLLAVGTSATMSTEGSHAEQRQTVANVASTLFGTEVQAADVIGETLRRATPELDFDDPSQIDALRARVRQDTGGAPTTYEEFLSDPLSSWIESTFGLENEEGRLVRRTPLPVRGAAGGAQQLATITGLDALLCRRVLESHLLAGYRLRVPESGFPATAFRLHQFISRGDTVMRRPNRKARGTSRLISSALFLGTDHARFCRLPFVDHAGRSTTSLLERTTLKMAECLSLETSVRHRQTVASTLASCTSARNVPGPMIRLAMSVCPMIGSNGPLMDLLV